MIESDHPVTPSKLRNTPLQRNGTKAEECVCLTFVSWLISNRVFNYHSCSFLG